MLVLVQDFPSGRIEIVELSRIDRPEKGPGARGDEQETEWDEYEEDVHVVPVCKLEWRPLRIHGEPASALRLGSKRI
jgi:hypothetical protein